MTTENSLEKINKGLLKEDKFYNKLTSCTNSDKNYEYVLYIWEALKINTAKDQHDKQ